MNVQNMDSFPSNRGWMYDRTYSGRRGLKKSFVEGVEEFVSKARQQDNYTDDGELDARVLNVI